MSSFTRERTRILRADCQVVKTRLQLSARKKHISPTFYSATPSKSPLPGPIAASAAALSKAGPSATAVPAQAPSKAAANAISTTLDIVRTEGFRGLYRGMSASYLGVSEGVIQWVLYEVSPLAVEQSLTIQLQAYTLALQAYRQAQDRYIYR